MKKKYLASLIFVFCLLFSVSIFADTFVFEPTTQKNTVTEYYLDVNGKTVKQKTVVNVDNNIYTRTAPSIDGYVCINARINDDDLYYTPNGFDYNDGVSVSLSSFKSNGDYVIYLYAEDSYNRGYPDDSTVRQEVTINYYDYSSGKKLDYDTYDNQVIGENYTYSPVISKTFNDKNYTFKSSKPELNDDDDVVFFVSQKKSNNVIDLYYTQGKSTDRFITIHNIDIETEEEFDKDIISNVQVGTTYTYDVESKNGYTFVSSSPSSSGISNSIKIDVKSDNDDNQIYCYYKKTSLDDSTTAWYDDNNQYYVSPTDTYFGDSYYYNTPLRSDGIELNSEPFYGIISGYGDGYFRPQFYITRAEAAQMFYNIAKNKNTGSINYSFSDLNSNDWYYTPIYYLTSNGLMQGYSDGTIRPNNYITRAEFTKMATTILGFEDTNTVISFSDVPKESWFYYYVKAGVNKGLVNGYANGTFRPNNKITRAEATKIVDTMIGRTENKESLYRDVYYNDVPTTDWSYKFIKMANGLER